MSETIALSRNAFIRIFTLFGYRSDDTSGHTTGPRELYGPGGPVLHEPLTHLAKTSLRWFRLHFGPHHSGPPDPPIVHVDRIETVAFGTQFMLASRMLGDSPLAPVFARAGKHVVTTGAKAPERSVAR
ncbi:hypothetical protein [Paraburkholderia caribensis]|uniref:hypothetical protein n=1 Tax=Paraburkholderia caribensis TaxID=75105 RepID=UPI0034D18171